MPCWNCGKSEGDSRHHFFSLGMVVTFTSGNVPSAKRPYVNFVWAAVVRIAVTSDYRKSTNVCACIRAITRGGFLWTTPNRSRVSRWETGFTINQEDLFSVMLIACRESPPTKGSRTLLERVFVVLKITLTRSKNAPNHQISKQKHNRKGGNLKRSLLC